MPAILVSVSAQKAGAEFADRSVSLSGAYVDSVVAAGGVPWLAPNLPDATLVREAVARVDGVVLTGGDDVQTQLYRQRLTPELRRTVGPADPDRDAFELMVIAEIFAQRKPPLAICRGLQILNVALGGTLLVDIPTQAPAALDHRRLDRKNEIVHDLELTPGSLLASLTGGTRLGANSSHHQAVDKVAGLLKVTARSADGIVEGLELRPGALGKWPFLIAVQFHPERLSARYREHAALFEGFVAACGRNSRNRYEG